MCCSGVPPVLVLSCCELLVCVVPGLGCHQDMVAVSCGGGGSSGWGAPGSNLPRLELVSPSARWLTCRVEI